MLKNVNIPACLAQRNFSSGQKGRKVLKQIIKIRLLTKIIKGYE